MRETIEKNLTQPQTKPDFIYLLLNPYFTMYHVPCTFLFVKDCIYMILEKMVKFIMGIKYVKVLLEIKHNYNLNLTY